jgi:hypothetical protein
MRRRVALAAAVAVAVLAVDAGITAELLDRHRAAQEDKPVPPAELRAGDAKIALAAFANFPAGSAERPVVLLTTAIGHPNFRRYGDLTAYEEDRWALEVDLPPAPPGDGGVSATDALRLLRNGRPIERGPGRRVALTRIRLGKHVFATDRGPQRLPAWHFSFRGAIGPVAVPAIDVRFAWQYAYGLKEADLPKVLVSPDGVRLTMLAMDLAPECGVEYRLDVTESHHAVHLGMWDVAAKGTGGRLRCETDRLVALDARLSAPLGGRPVLVDRVGPVVVQPGTWPVVRDGGD